MEGNMVVDLEASYDYEVIPEDQRKRKYCGSPKHGATNVQAAYIEKYKAPTLGITELVEAYACQDCHDQMMQAFLDECLPDPTEEELEQARIDGLAMG